MHPRTLNEGVELTDWLGTDRLTGQRGIWAITRIYGAISALAADQGGLKVWTLWETEASQPGETRDNH